MKAIICAGGNGSRWGNYTGRRKHMALFKCRPLLQQTIDQLYARGVTDVTVECHRDHPYEGKVEGAKFITSVDPTDVFVGRKALWKHFDNDAATLILLGDTYFSDRSMDIIVAEAHLRSDTAFHQIGRLSPSRATGKPGPEMFGWILGCQRHHDFIKAIEVCQDHKAKGPHPPLFNDWSIYQAMAGRFVATHPSRLEPGDCHLELPDDGTDDFDFSDDYERFFHYMWHRSSRRVMVRDFHQEWFKNRMAGMHRSFALHRKLWEHCSVAQAFVDRFVDSADSAEERRGKYGYKAIGFGVGKEPIPAYLAQLGVAVTATDRPDPGVWLKRQHATGALDLVTEGICTQEQADTLIGYLPVDMNAIPSGLTGHFDFSWSSSCFEHLGGIEAGLRFFCEQMKCLKPGGVAAHTTEWNTLDNTVTLNGKDLCVFRTQDFDRLAAMLEAQGDRLWPIDYQQGDEVADRYVDAAPYQQEPHLQIALGGSVFTSVILIAQRGRT